MTLSDGAINIISITYIVDGHAMINTTAIFPFDNLKHIVTIIVNSTYHDVGMPHIPMHHA